MRLTRFYRPRVDLSWPNSCMKVNTMDKFTIILKSNGKIISLVYCNSWPGDSSIKGICVVFDSSRVQRIIGCYLHNSFVCNECHMLIYTAWCEFYIHSFCRLRTSHKKGIKNESGNQNASKNSG